jgi:hypothetical protein
MFLPWKIMLLSFLCLFFCDWMKGKPFHFTKEFKDSRIVWTDNHLRTTYCLRRAGGVIGSESESEEGAEDVVSDGIVVVVFFWTIFSAFLPYFLSNFFILRFQAVV